MSNLLKTIGRTATWIVSSIVMMFVLFYITVIVLEELSIYDIGLSEETLAIGLFFISLIITRLAIFRGPVKPDITKYTKSRDKVVNLPQFRGSVDREKGVVEATARNVVWDRTSDIGWGGAQKEYNVLGIRAEILDVNGTPVEYIPLEIKGESRKWVGNLVEGDRFRVEGKFEKDGILHSKFIFNYSTNSIVGEKK
jgi:hypothetical protein